MVRAVGYYLIDVFTDRAFGGNPQAVFTNGNGLSVDVMQNIARELNVSETIFVLGAEEGAEHPRLRVFTPATELPSAGHPPIAAAFALAQERRLAKSERQNRYVFEHSTGPISVRMQSPMLTVQQPAPEFGPIFEDRDAVAAMLSLQPQQLMPDLPLCSIRSTIPFLCVPVVDLAAMAQIRLRVDIWERVLRDWFAPHLFVFTHQARHPGAMTHSRMFAPGLGVHEDPATANAAGSLAAYALRYGLVQPEPELSFINEQGVEMGRPSLIYVTVQQRGQGGRGAIRVGGQCVQVGDGRLFVED